MLAHVAGGGAPRGGGARPPAAAGTSDLGALELLIDAIAERIGERVESRLAERDDSDLRPVVVDRRGLAVALGCSVDTIDRLRREGIPRVRVGDTERYEIDRVLEWLRDREGGS